MRLFLKHAKRDECIRSSIKAALVVGTLLAIINHYPSLISGTLNTREAFQILLTYSVPYAVATYGFAMQARSQEIRDLKSLISAERYEVEKVCVPS